MPDETAPQPPGERPLTIEDVERRLLGRHASLSRREVSREADVSLLAARRLWHALGFQIVEDEESMFTEADVRALQSVVRVVRQGGADTDLVLAMTRALARSADRLAVWQTQLVAEHLTPVEQEPPAGSPDARGVPDLAIAEATAAYLVEMADEIDGMLSYVWRRHLSHAIGRMLTDARNDERHDASAPNRVVGFADLVSFTTLVRRMTERQLGVLVQRFEELASDVVTTHGGRVIKTVGDEILFVHVDPAAGAAIGLDLVDAMAEDPLLPALRVGMAYGHVVSRLGDVFGTTVNRASRLTAVTRPGHVLVDDILARRLAAVSGFTATGQRPRHLRGIGTITPAELRRASTGRRESPAESVG